MRQYTCSGCAYNFLKYSKFKGAIVFKRVSGGSCVPFSQYTMRDIECERCYYWEQPQDERTKYKPLDSFRVIHALVEAK
jgi:hypothetical protein